MSNVIRFVLVLSLMFQLAWPQNARASMVDEALGKVKAHCKSVAGAANYYVCDQIATSYLVKYATDKHSHDDAMRAIGITVLALSWSALTIYLVRDVPAGFILAPINQLKGQMSGADTSASISESPAKSITPKSQTSDQPKPVSNGLAKSV